MRRLARREFLELLGLGASTIVGLNGCSAAPFSSERVQPSQSLRNFVPDAELQLTATETLASILPGQLTRVWKYEGEVLEGGPASLQTIPNSYLGPIIRAKRGQKLRVHLNNALREATIVHWHGLHVPPEMDGHPRNAILPGKSYVYDLEIRNRAGTYWFHPHPHQRTGFQVYGGLAGLLLVSDDEEATANLPGGEFDVPLVIQDRAFNVANQLVYVTNPMVQMNGVLGDHILVNGRITTFKAEGAPVDAYGVGSSLLRGQNDFTADVVRVDGRPLAKAGRRENPIPGWSSSARSAGSPRRADATLQLGSRST